MASESNQVKVLPNPAGFLFLLLMLYIFSGPGYSQRYFTRNYSVVDGLPSSTVFEIAQDSVGMLWCATPKGVCRYDGTNWINFNNITGHLGYGHRAVKCDEKGNIWTISNTERIVISVFRDKKWHTYLSEPSPLPNEVPMAFEIFHRNNEPVLMFSTTQSGMVVREKKHWTHYSPGKDFPGSRIIYISRDLDQYFITTDQGIFTLQNGRFDLRKGWNPQLPSLEVLSVKRFRTNENSGVRVTTWVLGKDWLGYFTGDRFSLVTTNFFLYADDPLTKGIVTPLQDGSVYFGNLQHLYYLTPDDTKPVKLGRHNGLIGEGILSLFLDREKNIWIGSLRGLSCIPFTRFVNFSTSDGLPDNEVSCGLEIKPGNYVFGLDAALAYYDETSFTTRELTTGEKHAPHEERVQDLCLDHDGNVWAAVSYEGVARITPSRQVTWFNHLFPPGERFVAVEEKDDQTMLVGCMNGLFEMKNGKVTPILNGNKRIEGVRKIFFDKNKDLFIGTFGYGLYKISSEGVIEYKDAKNRHGNNIFSFLHDSRGNYWVGTIDGLYQITDKGFHRSKDITLPPERAVYLIMEDHLGNIWFGTDDGVFRWDGQIIQHFTVRDGLSGPDINRDAGFVDSYNRIWFGTNQGITRINNRFDKVLRNVPAPKIFIDSLITQSGRYTVKEMQNLSFNENNLDFQFTTVSFLDNKRSKVCCRLVPFEEEWSEEISADSRSYRYHNLPPGNYQFHIKVKNSLGNWSDEIVSPVIRIGYPLYLQWWFILIVVSLLGYLAYIVFKYIIYRRYNLRLAETVSQRTRELEESQQKLMQSNKAKDRFFSIIGHDLRSPFNVILGYLDLLTDKSFTFSPGEREDILEKLKQTAHRTLNLLDNLLSWARTQKGEQHAEITVIDICEIIQENLTLAESVATAKKIRLLKSGCEHPILAMGDKNMIHTVVRNLISNAIKFSYPGGVIEIITTPGEKETVVVSVKDYGCGISSENKVKIFNEDEHFATKGTGKESGTGLGLILCMEFIRLNNGRIWMESEAEKGSTFSFSLNKAIEQ